jgi:hypothetical protein
MIKVAIHPKLAWLAGEVPPRKRLGNGQLPNSSMAASSEGSKQFPEELSA